MKKGKLVKLLGTVAIAAAVLVTGTLATVKDIKAEELYEGFHSLEEAMNGSKALFAVDDAGDYVFEYLESGECAGSVPTGAVFMPGEAILVRNSETPLENGKKLVVKLDGCTIFEINSNEGSYRWNATKPYPSIIDNTVIFTGIVEIEGGYVLLLETDAVKIRLADGDAPAFAYDCNENGKFYYNTKYSHDEVTYMVPNEEVCYRYYREIKTDCEGKYIDKSPVLIYEKKDGSSGELQLYVRNDGILYFRLPSLTTGKSWRPRIETCDTTHKILAIKVVEDDTTPVNPRDYKKPEEKKEEKEEKKEESSSSSDNKSTTPALTPAQQAKATEQAQAVVGSKAYAEKQAEVQKSVATAVAAITKLTPAQVATVAKTGVAVNLGGCTSIDRTTVTTMAKNNTIPYNMGFTWNGVNFVVKVPAGVNYLSLIDANGNLQMWKLVQKYGIAGATIAK